MESNVAAYVRAQRAIVELKAAVLELVGNSPDGISNADLGRTLGIYKGHKGHEGHVSRTLLDMLETEGLVIQDLESKAWALRKKSC